VGARCGDQAKIFTTLSVPVMTRLRMSERSILDTLVAGGVARSRSDALAWCVRLVGMHQADWIKGLRDALVKVDEARSKDRSTSRLNPQVPLLPCGHFDRRGRAAACRDHGRGTRRPDRRYELFKHDIPVTILEKDAKQVGGLARTVEHKGYRFDIGGHRFFSKNQEVEDLWTEILRR